MEKWIGCEYRKVLRNPEILFKALKPLRMVQKVGWEQDSKSKHTARAKREEFWLKNWTKSRPKTNLQIC